MTATTFQLEPLTCPSCITKIETVLGKTAGVQQVQVLFNSSKVRISHEESIISKEELADKLHKLGYPVKNETT